MVAADCARARARAFQLSHGMRPLIGGGGSGGGGGDDDETRSGGKQQARASGERRATRTWLLAAK